MATLSISNLNIPRGPKPMTNLISAMPFIMSMGRDIMRTMDGMFNQYVDTFSFEIMGGRQFVLSHPDHIQEVLLTQANKFHKDADYKNEESGLARFMGNGLVTSDGEFWKRQRKLASPAMHAKRIQNYAGTMTDYTVR